MGTATAEKIETKDFNLKSPGEENIFYRLVRNRAKDYGFELLEIPAEDGKEGVLSTARYGLAKKYERDQQKAEFIIRKGPIIGMIKGSKKDLVRLVSITGTQEDIEKIKLKLEEASDSLGLKEV